MRWLNDYVKADMPIKEFVADMTMSGSKVETYHKIESSCSLRKRLLVSYLLSAAYVITGYKRYGGNDGYVIVISREPLQRE